MEWYLKVVRDNYANFKGRARRKEFWMFILINMIIQQIFGVLDNILGFKVETQTIDGYEWVTYIQTGYLGYIYSLAVIIPCLAVTVRRFHDVGKSGWNLLWYFTCIGFFYQLYLWVSEGDHGQNEYGQDPKNADDHDPFAGQRDNENPYNNSNGHNPYSN